MTPNKEHTNEELFNRNRTFFILLYPDTKSYVFDDVLSYIRSQKDYAYIKHIPETEEKKEHYHVIVHFDNPKTIDQLSRKTNIPSNHIQYVKSFREVCRYMTHVDYEDKIHYDLSDVVVSRNFQRKFLKQYDDIKTEEEIISDIYNYIDELIEINNYSIRLKSLVIFVNSNCYDTVYKRYRNEFIEALKSTY